MKQASAPVREVGPSVGTRQRTLPLVLKYGIAASLTQVIYLGTFGGALLLGSPYMAAIVLAQLVAIAYAFPTYRRRVFDAQEGPVYRQFATFLGVWWLGAAMSLLGVPLLVEGLGLSPLLAQLIVMVSAATFTFLAHRGVTFRLRPRLRSQGQQVGKVSTDDA